MCNITNHCQGPFVSEELGEKFANAVNYCLYSLVKTGTTFRIRNPERFHFDPRKLLTNIVTMYANMGGSE